MLLSEITATAIELTQLKQSPDDDVWLEVLKGERDVFFHGVHVDQLYRKVQVAQARVGGANMGVSFWVYDIEEKACYIAVVPKHWYKVVFKEGELMITLANESHLEQVQRHEHVDLKPMTFSDPTQAVARSKFP